MHGCVAADRATNGASPPAVRASPAADRTWPPRRRSASDSARTARIWCEVARRTRATAGATVDRAAGPGPRRPTPADCHQSPPAPTPYADSRTWRDAERMKSSPAWRCGLLRQGLTANHSAVPHAHTHAHISALSTHVGLTCDLVIPQRCPRGGSGRKF